MPTVAVRCPHCQATYQVADSALGREMVCPHCRRSFTPIPLEDSSSKRSSPWWWLSDDAVRISSPPTVPWEGRPPSRGVRGDLEARRRDPRPVRGPRGVHQRRARAWSTASITAAGTWTWPSSARGRSSSTSEQDKEDFEQRGGDVGQARPAPAHWSPATTSAAWAASRASSPSTSPAAAWPSGSARGSSTPAGRTRRWSASSTWPSSSPGACSTPTSRGWSTATSSRATSC